MKRRIAVFVFLGMLGLNVFSAWGGEISLGFTLPLTGLFSKTGKRVLDSYKLWAKKVNSQGGILIGGDRYPVKLIFYDDRSNPALSARFYEKLITEDKVDLLLGGYGSSVVFAASSVSEKYKYPFVCGGASSNRLFERGFRYFFATLGKATDEVRGCVEMLRTFRPRPETVAIIGTDILFTSLACEGFKKYSLEAGFRVVHYELFPITLEDYTTMLKHVKAKSPDVLLVGSHTQVAIHVLKALRRIQFFPKCVIFSYGPTAPDFVRTMGKNAEYIFAASEWTADLPYRGEVFGTAADFDKDFYRAYHRHPDYVEAAAAAAAVTLQIALKSLKLHPPYTETKREVLMEKLHKMKIETFFGTIRFGEEGANVAHPPIVVQIQNGVAVSVYPEKLRRKKPIFPLPRQRF